MCMRRAFKSALTTARFTLIYILGTRRESPPQPLIQNSRNHNIIDTNGTTVLSTTQTTMTRWPTMILSHVFQSTTLNRGTLIRLPVAGAERHADCPQLDSVTKSLG